MGRHYSTGMKAGSQQKTQQRVIKITITKFQIIKSILEVLIFVFLTHRWFKPIAAEQRDSSKKVARPAQWAATKILSAQSLPFFDTESFQSVESCYKVKGLLGVGQPHVRLFREKNKMLQPNLPLKLSANRMPTNQFTTYCKGAPLEVKHHCTRGWRCECKHGPHLTANVPYSWKHSLGFYVTKVALSKSDSRGLMPSSSTPGYTFKAQQYSGYGCTFL